MLHLTKYGQKLNPALQKEVEEVAKNKHKRFIVFYFDNFAPATKQAIKYYHISRSKIVGYVN